VQSTLEKVEKGPSDATVTMLTRQSSVSSVASDGKIAISAVSPPPFFHGMRR
jgi:hypothetical protein